MRWRSVASWSCSAGVSEASVKSWLSIVSVRLTPLGPLVVLVGVSWTMKPFALELPRDRPVADAIFEQGRSEQGCFYAVRWPRHCMWMR